MIITRYQKVHDGRAAYQKIKNKSHSNTMMQFVGEKVVWMVHKESDLWNKLELLHEYGVFGRILPRTPEIVVLTPEGAELVLTETL